MESLWEKITDLDKLNYASQAEQPIVKSQFRIKRNALSSQKSSIQIHLYASLILFICASHPKAKISLTPEVQYQLNSESNQLIIHKNEKSFQLRLNDQDNMNKWAEALTKLGIAEKNSHSQQFLEKTAGRLLPSYATLPSDSLTHKLQHNSSTSKQQLSRRDQLQQANSASCMPYQNNTPQSARIPTINNDDEGTITLSLCDTGSFSTCSKSNCCQTSAQVNEQHKTGKKANQRLNSKRRASQQENIYAAPETLKPSMEHFIINTNYLYRKASMNYFEYITCLRGLERIPEEQECCD
ncbi:hypothetical protein ABPG72_011780 [Tetrahymena utriculariae]